MKQKMKPKMKPKMKRAVALILTGILGITGLPTFSGAETVLAQSQEEKTKAEALIEEGTVTIGNRYISRVFNISEDKISTEVIRNKRAGLDFRPLEDSEEFIIRFRKSDIKTEGEIDRSGWDAQASDQYNNTPGAEDGPGENLIDGDVGTIWHSQYEPDAPYPHSVVFDMKKEETVRAFSYLPRQGENAHGDIGGYEIYVGNSREDLEDSENLAAAGYFSYEGRETIYVNFPEAKTGRYVELKAVSPKTEGEAWASGAEFRLYRQPVEGASDDWSMNLRASDLTLNRDGMHIEDTENGIMAVFPFETYWKSGVNWNITMKVVMDDGDHFMRKFLEIEVDDPEKAAIDYIDLESLNVNENDAVWTRPEMGEGVGGMSGYIISLGQPVYIQGMFLGCEFPLTETEIDEKNNAHMRYYSGKNFLQLEEDQQTTVDGKYVTWQTVVGAARSTDIDVIRSDFFEYIDQIATKTDFRTQYNSWYDNMMGINDENIASAFIKMEKGLSESGVIPMDSYVVDDGWNNYNTEKYHVYDEENCGTTYNETGFWEFNSKFPNGFIPASELARSLSSSFGVWVGPRGGYGYNEAMGHIVEDGGDGAYNAQSWDIDVGDRRYIRRMTELLTQMQDTYKVNYWKLDGFAAAACTNSSHDHMTGGKNEMYYFTDAWEGWIDLFETLRKNAQKNGIEDLWLNLTCRVNPSPWHLQWANSIWLQNAGDHGWTDVGQNRAVDQLLSYRDGRYFDFVKAREFQFPLSYIYNHDPIYGKEDTGLENQINDEEFAVYLYMMATRGTAFWELYYTPEMMDEGEKWAINARVLEWARENHHILKHAKLIGSTPEYGNTYGYSCWDGAEGIVSMRNPSGEVKNLEFVLDGTCGVEDDLEGQTFQTTTVLNYKSAGDDSGQTFSYGDKITVTLQPGEARIWSFSTEKDQIAPQVRFAKARTDKEIEIAYDENICIENLAATVEERPVQTRLSADGRTLWLTTETSMTDGAKASVKIDNVEDLSGNSSSQTLVVPYYEEELAGAAYTASDLKNAADVSEGIQNELAGKNAMKLEGSYEIVSENAINGNTDFAVSAYVKTESCPGSLICQGNEYELALDEEGKLLFQVGDVSVTSRQTVNDGIWRHVAGVRERNGVLKVYVDGKLDSSVYDEKAGIREVKEDAVTVGSPEMPLQISQIEIKNSTLSLEELKEKRAILGRAEPGITPDENGKIPLSASRVSVRRADTGEFIPNEWSPMENMIDGNVSGDSYTYADEKFESAVLEGTSVYFQVDLGNVFSLDQIKLWRPYQDGRYYKDTMIVCSEDAVFDQADTVIYSTVTDENYSYGLLDTNRMQNPHEQYSETAEGKRFQTEGVRGRYIRIYMRGSAPALESEPSHGGCHICELEVYGESLSQSDEDYTVSFRTNGGGKIEDVKGKKGETFQLPQNPQKEGYRFDGWYTNINCTQPYDGKGEISANLTLFAKWKKLHTVSFQTDGGTLIEDVTVEDGERIALPEDPERENYVFRGWYTNYHCTLPYEETSAVEKDMILYAKWKEDSHQEEDLTLEESIRQAKEAQKKAEEAQAAAEAAKADADAAKAEAQALKTAAETAKNEAEAAMRAAQDAIAQAGEESEAAKAAMEMAIEKAHEAEQAKQAAEAAKTAAETAKVEAETARTEAEELLSTARAMAEQAEAKAAEAEAEAKAAEGAKKEAQEEREKAEEARRAAEAAEAEILKIKEELAKLQQEALKNTDITEKVGKVSLKSVKRQKKGSLKVTWKKVEGATGYEIVYSRNSKFKNAVTKKVNSKKTSFVLKKLKSRKKYYVKIRAVKTTQSGAVYGVYSRTKSQKAK